MTKTIISKTRKHISKAKMSTKKSLQIFDKMMKSRRVFNMGLRDYITDANFAAEQLLELLRKTEKKLYEYEQCEILAAKAEAAFDAKIENRMSCSFTKDDKGREEPLWAMYKGSQFVRACK
jgi:hypothetical protein